MSLSSPHMTCCLIMEMHLRTEKDLFFRPTDILGHMTNGACHTGGRKWKDGWGGGAHKTPSKKLFIILVCSLCL